jgi:hypothetical protein
VIYYYYDIETYIDTFTMCVRRTSDGGRWVFEISPRRHDGIALMEFLTQVRNSDGEMMGFNNVGFDYVVLHELIQRGGNISAYELYVTGQNIINSNSRFGVYIAPRDVYVKQVDLFKIHHFDNQSKSTSLKMLECNMRMLNIKDLPYSPHEPLSSEQIDQLIKYNWHDVGATVMFGEFSKDMVSFREKLSVQYNSNFMNHNDTKIGKDVFIKRLEKANVQCYEYLGGKRQPRQTHRPVIDLNTCVFASIHFRRPEFIAVKEWMQAQQIKETKGVFSLIHENRLGDVAQYATLVEKQKRYEGQELQPLEWFETKKNGNVYIKRRQATTLNVMVDGFQFDFGVGGIHGSVESTTVRSTEAHQIIDLDVASYYPNLAIANNLFPAHLSELFCTIYKDVYDERQSYGKGTAENAMLKLALNGVYGDSNNQYSAFYDPAYTMSITLNGQLLLCLLAERLMNIPGLSMIQINTDGLTVSCPREWLPTLRETSQTWEAETRLELESVNYDVMFIRDVNSYIAVDEKGGVKRKGAYATELAIDNPNTKELEWHKNQGNRVAALAANAFLIDGVSIRDFIVNHDDVFDFLMRVKLPRSMRLELRHPNGFVKQCENITRYYVNNSGGSLFKIMPPLEPGATGTRGEERVYSVEAGWHAQPCNDINADYVGDICYEYYIQAAEKLVKPVINC